MAKRRTASSRSHSLPERPVAAEMPLRMALTQSLDQRSPQRFSVTFTLSTPSTISPSACTRGVMRPWTSPRRNTMRVLPPSGTVRRMRPASWRSTEMVAAIMPTVRPQPTMAAIRSSLMQFWRETT